MPTPTLEEYLETIYKIGLEGDVRPTQIAEAIGVSGPTVTATLRRLESRGLITRSGALVVLTEAGTAEALGIVRRHRVAERFLVDMLGLDWEAAHEDACLLEHAMSERVLVALEGILDNPAVCPHGHPIPSPDGRVTARTGRSLAQAAPDDRLTILRVAEDEDVLGYLGSLGLVPGTPVDVVSTTPAAGLLTVLARGTEHVLSLEVARHVTVEERNG